ncbi:SDR family NAD(P)-dependent oxidoreductase [Streptomyces goshikiensis]|uniref:type I polyketide synthase n=1 Tax=Streptomyces goshikiensis TaxID=1942 RepID=UPI0036C2A81C
MTKKDLAARLAGLSPEKRALLDRVRSQAPGAGSDGDGNPASEPIAIIGMGCRFPGGADGPDAFWELLRKGVDATGPVPSDRWDADRLYDEDPERPGRIYARRGGFLSEPVDGFDAAFFGISPREAQSLDPQQRLLLEVVWEALEHAATAPAVLKGSRTGVYVGIGIDDYKTLQTADPEAIDAYTGTGNLFCAAAGRISHFFGLTGPSMAVDTGCSSSLVAVHLAVRSLRQGESDMAVAAGVHLMLSPEITLFLSRARALSPEGRCRTFDAAADGYARGEGCGAVVLKRLSDARAAGDRVLAVIRGSAVNHDGPSAGLTVPNGTSQQALLRTALADARLRPHDIGYLEAHGTGTRLGDPVEAGAFSAVLAAGRPRRDPLLAGSVKTNIGHLEAAAGIASLIKVVLALGHEEIPPHLHFDTPNPHIPWADVALRVPTEPTPWRRAQRPRNAGISSFGIGGTNAHLVVTEAPGTAVPETPSGPHDAHPTAGHVPGLLLLSAKGRPALDALAARYADRLDEHLPLSDVVRTAASGRDHFGDRLAIVASSSADARSKLADWAGGTVRPGVLHGTVRPGGPPRTAFLFTGQGAQYFGMGQDLYRAEPVFRQAVDRCAQWLGNPLGADVTGVISGSSGPAAPDPHGTGLAQPALFALQYALTELWASWEVRPAAVLGHSVGEYAAACAAGVLDPRDAARLVAERARLMAGLPGGGAMAVVRTDPDHVERLLALRRTDRLAVAAYNGPAETVVSGDADELDALLGLLEEEGVAGRRLEVSHGFHSPLMEPVLGPYAGHLDGVALRPAVLPFFSTVTGARTAPADVADKHYWLSNIREPVRYEQALRALLDDGCDAFVEIGPRPALTGTARRAGLQGDRPDNWVGALAPQGDGHARILGSLGRLYVLGAGVRPDGESPAPSSRVALPTYPFQRRRHWRDTRGRTRSGGGRAEPPFPGRRLRSPGLADTVFHNRYDASSPSWLADHLLFDTVVVPGAAHLASLLGAVREVRGDGPTQVHEVVFPQALALPANRAREVQVVLAPPAPGQETRFFRVVSAPADEADDDWTTHASGAVTAGPPPGHDGRTAGEMPAVLARCRTLLSGDELYERMLRAGYGLGPGFRWVRSVRHRDGEAIAELRRPAAADDRHPLHPGLIDACFQAVTVLVPHALQRTAGESQSLHVPLRIDRLHHHRTPAPAEILWLHIEEQPTGRDEDGLVVDLTLRGEDGGLVLEMAAVRLGRVARAALVDGPTGPPGAALHTVHWERAGSPARAPRAGAPERWLILADDAAVAGELARLLRETRAAEVEQATSAPEGPDGRPRLDPTRPEDVRELVAQASAAGPLDRVVGLWLTAAPESSPDCAPHGSPAAAAALHLIQAVAEAPGAPGLALVTGGGQHVTPDEVGPRPEFAALWGLGAVASAEAPHLRCDLVDLDPRGSANLPLLLAELTGPAPSVPLRVAHRGGERYTRRLRALPHGPERAPVLRPDATYLVTGGTGGVGLHVARRLADRGARHLALLARRAPGPEADRAVEALRAAGVQVHVVHADVADHESLDVAIAALEAAGPAIRGVVHAAGVLHDATLVRQDAGRLTAVRAPKAPGAVQLRQALAGRSLDFLALFSSAAAWAGTLGQGAYAAANAELDALAQQWRQEGLPATSIGWGAWAATGMAAGLDRADVARLAEQGVGQLDPDQALDLLDRVLAGPVPAHVLALRTAPEPAGPPAHEPGGQQPAWHPRGAGLGTRVNPDGPQEELLTAIWEEAFRMRPLGVEDDFFALGGDSMLALTVTARLRRQGLPLKESDFFRHPTIRELVRVLDHASEPGASGGGPGRPGGEGDSATPVLTEASRRLLSGGSAPENAASAPPHPFLTRRLRTAAGPGNSTHPRTSTQPTRENGGAS